MHNAQLRSASATHIMPIRAPQTVTAANLGQYRTTPVRQIARKLNKVELRFFVRVHKFDAGGLTPGKEN